MNPICLPVGHWPPQLSLSYYYPCTPSIRGPGVYEESRTKNPCCHGGAGGLFAVPFPHGRGCLVLGTVLLMPRLLRLGSSLYDLLHC